MVRPRPIRSTPSTRGVIIPTTTVRNAALCLISLSGIILIAAYAFLFSLPDAGDSRALVFDGEDFDVIDKRGGGTAVSSNNNGPTGGDSSVRKPPTKTVAGGTIDAGGGLRLAKKPVTTTTHRTVAENANKDAASNVRATVAYAVSLTGCPKDDPLTDGGAVLKHSIHLQSALHPASKSQYGYKMYAIVHPDVTDCAKQLEAVGYELLVRDVPVPVDEIKGDFLRTKVVVNGCCGEKEYIKLHAYTLLDHPIVVHLDLDTIVLRPMDALFDAMLDESTKTERTTTDLPVMFDKSLPPRVDAFFTRDYNMAKPGKKHVGVQGGFLVLRPSMEAYNNFADIIREGNFVEGKGWGGQGYGPFYGSMTFQGIIPYYYDELHPNTAVELNKCYYNAMADNPRDKPTVNDVVSGKCRDGREICEDCRELDVSVVTTAHFTLCQKPWSCLPHSQDQLQHRLCRKLHHEWFRVRSDLEGRKGEGDYQTEQFYGFCNRSGGRGYIPINVQDIG